ncbi:hypothetical protein DEJ36_02720 [Curtobacterium sp. MCPF17_052]|nr:hypothetical protein [Curtobacterium sp. MCPF17_052]WIB12943.1 hypothetical protein DEJ36_02720 [Curtobacterium sp. MCPF17_052]
MNSELLGSTTKPCTRAASARIAASSASWSPWVRLTITSVSVPASSSMPSRTRVPKVSSKLVRTTPTSIRSVGRRRAVGSVLTTVVPTRGRRATYPSSRSMSSARRSVIALMS